MQTLSQQLQARIKALETEREGHLLLLTRLTMDLFAAKRLSPGQALVIWPAGLAEVATKRLGLLIRRGSEALSPQDRLQHIQRPVEEVDNAMIVQVVQHQVAPAQEEAPAAPKLTLLNGKGH